MRSAIQILYAALRWTGIAGAMLAASLVQAPAQSLPGAPGIKQGVIKRGTDGRIILDAEARDPLADLTRGHREKGVGTGFFVSAEGHILTNQHVIAGCRLITAQDVEGGAVIAELASANETLDLALLRSGAEPPAVARFSGDKTPLPAHALLRTHGYPTLTLTPVNPVETALTLLDEKPGISRMVLRGELFPGNSGGPILDARGRVVGVAVAKLNTVALYQKTGLMIEDISYAITGPAAFDFLARNAVSPDTSDALSRPPSGENRIVARIGCWS